MTGPFEIHTFAAPDQMREFPHGRAESVVTSHGTYGRGTFEPGWRWSTSIKPIAQTDLCQVDHFLYLVSGVLHVQMADGTERDIVAGDVAHIPPGHDAWVVGDETAVQVDLVADASLTYAMPPA